MYTLARIIIVSFLSLPVVAAVLRGQHLDDIRVSPSRADSMPDAQPRFKPGIALIDGVLVTTWTQVRRTQQVAVWSGHAPATLVDSRETEDIPRRQPSFHEEYRSSETETADTIASFDGALGLSAAYRYRGDYFMRIESSGTDPREYFAAHSTLLFARPEGWRVALDIEDSTISYGRTHCRVSPCAWDPNRRELIAYYTGTEARTGLSVYAAVAFSADGGQTWAVALDMIPSTLIPADSGQVLAVKGGNVELHTGVGGSWSRALPAVSGTVAYMRQLGASFIRYTVAPGAFTVDRFDLDAAPHGSLRLQDNVAEPFILQDRRDSSLLVLYARDGIRLTRITKNLEVVFRDSLVSAARVGTSRPAGAMRGDTLFVVWDDDRNGTYDIYGNAIQLPALNEGSLSATDDRPASAIGHAPDIERLAPNPARDGVTLTCRMAGTGVLELVDDQGKMVRRQELAAQGITERTLLLSTRDLRSGTYTVQLRSGGAVARARLVLLR